MLFEIQKHRLTPQLFLQIILQQTRKRMVYLINNILFCNYYIWKAYFAACIELDIQILRCTLYQSLIYSTRTMAGIAVLCLVFVFVLSLDTQEVTAARCRNYCDYASSGRGTYPCTKKGSKKTYYYKACGFLWLRRCQKSYVKVIQQFL